MRLDDRRGAVGVNLPVLGDVGERVTTVNDGVDIFLGQPLGRREVDAPHAAGDADAFDVQGVSHDNDNQGYAAKVTVRGAEKPEVEQSFDGERYERTLESESEVQELLDLGMDEVDIPHRTFTDPRLGSKAAVDRRAATRLEECVRIRSIRGDLEVVPTVVMPGYRYYVEEFDDEVDLESVTFTMGYGEASGTLQFTEEQTLAIDVSELSLGVEQNRQAL